MKQHSIKRTICMLLAVVMLIGVLPTSIFAASNQTEQAQNEDTNPYLPSWEYFADGEPHVFFDPKTGTERVYIYGSHDLADVYGGGCLGDYMAWSCPVDDLNNWTCEGVLYDKTEDPNLRGEGKNILASDCCYKNGKYYLFYGGGVAISDFPGGPFKFYGRVHYADGTQIGQAFDPAILVDDDGRNWLYTGGKSQVVELEDDMLTIKGGDVRLIPRADEMDAAIADPSLFPNVTNVADIKGFAFYEGSSIRKINGTYYLIWCNEKTHEFSYATAQNPTGPFTFRGVIISNAGIMDDAADEKATYPWGNIHGGILELNGQYYIFYHRQANGMGTRWWSARQVCAEPITFNADGSIVRTEMTSQGLNGKPLNAFDTYNADITCYLCTPEGAQESPKKFGPYVNELDEQTHVITNLVDGSIAGYKYFDFGAAPERVMQLNLELRSNAVEGTISAYLDDPANGRKIGEVSLKKSESTAWHTVTMNTANVVGTHALYLVFNITDSKAAANATLCEVKSFGFEEVSVMDYSNDRGGLNPYLPSWEYFADGEPKVFFDPKTGTERVYIYGSHDLADVYGGGCLGDYMAWSAPVDDLTNWTCEGVLYDKTEDPNLRGDGKNILASDCCYKDGRYYLFYGGGVAISDFPGGPFKFYGRVHYADGTQIGQAFDPAILVDDDGRNWLYTGGKSQVVELEDDMLTIKGGDVRLIPRADEMDAAIADPSLFPNVTNVADIKGFAFYEGSSIRKINGTYYLIWCNEKTHEYSYATAQNPAGPFTFRGVILSNAGIMDDFSGEKATYPWGNIHGGILNLNGQFYIFYHRQANGMGTRWWSARQACAEPITFNADGSIVRVEMTSQGLTGKPMDAFRAYPADMACYLCTPEGAQESPKKFGPYVNEIDRDTHVIANVVNNSIAGYKYFDFGDNAEREMKLDLELRSMAQAGTISVYLDNPTTGTKIGEVSLKKTESTKWHTVTVDVENVTGTHAVYLVFNLTDSKAAATDTLCELRSLAFRDVAQDALTIVAAPETFVGKVGDTAAFSVAVNRTDVTYQWMYSNNGGATWSKSTMQGADTAALSVKMTALRVGQQYKVVVTDSLGNSVETAPVALTEQTAACAIVENPADAVAAVGATATFAVKAEGEGLTYQWMYSNNGGASWSKSTAPGAATAAMSIEAKAFRNGQMYKCIVTDANGNAVESTAAAIVIEK